ncbi:hypothetical protein N9Y81_02850 [Akkermansiaceae bacterium]|jgi:hypothetical protein|nr:hypothetical protein [Akkermansiaceae bacterium]
MKSYTLHKGLGWPGILFGLLVFVAAILVFVPLFLRTSPGGDRTKALANAKSIVGGLLSFKSDYGVYPCDATRKKMEGDPDQPSPHDPLSLLSTDVLPPGTSANAYLAQLIASDHVDTEKIFYAPGVIGAKEGDNIVGSSDKLLEPGENCFAYIMAKGGDPLTDTRAYTPLVLAPVKARGESEPIFDGGPYSDKFVMGLVDGSARTGEISKDGKALLKDGTSLFQTGPDSLFGKDTPVVKYPLFPKP